MEAPRGRPSSVSVPADGRSEVVASEPGGLGPGLAASAAASLDKSELVLEIGREQSFAEVRAYIGEAPEPALFHLVDVGREGPP